MPEVSSSVEVGAEGDTFPLMEILTGRGFITGKSGSGKSNTASVVAEELLEEGLPLLVIDTDGEYYGLKAEFEMLQIGVGSNCDVELGPERADDIAELAVVENVPIILDVSGFVEQSEAEELVDAVLKQVFALENEHQKPFLVLVEELHEFVPEQQSLPPVGETIIRIAKRGRKRGLGVVGMSQRPAAVDKDYITQCNWLIWHRLTWDNDTQVVDRIMGGDSAETVQALDDGEALVLTDWDERTRRLQFRRKRTFDAGSTPTLSDAERPSLKTVDQSLIEKLQAGDPGAATPDDGSDAVSTSSLDGSETDSIGSTDQTEAGSTDVSDDRAITRSGSSILDDSSGDEPVTDSSGSVRTGPSARPTDDTDRKPYEPPTRETGDTNFLWEFGQLVWYLFRVLLWHIRSGLRRLRLFVATVFGRARNLALRGRGRNRTDRLAYQTSDRRFANSSDRLTVLVIGLLLVGAVAVALLAL